MKSFRQFCSEAIVLAKKGGVEGKLDKSTGKFTAGNFSDAERARYTKYSAKPAATTTRAVAPASRPAATPTMRPTPAASRPAPKKDERPTVGQVQAAKREAETRRYRDTASFSASLGGVAKLAAQQRDANRNSLVSKGAELERQASTPDWKKHPHTLNKKVGRGYGVPKLSGMLQDNSRSQLTDYYMKKGMSRADAEAKASSEAQQIHDRNRANYRSGSGYD